jgi:hypothetical protein
MTPGKPYAISVENRIGLSETPSWQQQIWGATSRCGMGGETADLLDEHLLDHSSTYCSTIMPAKAYTEVIVIRKALVSGALSATSGYGLCPDVTCPANR